MAKKVTATGNKNVIKNENNNASITDKNKKSIDATTPDFDQVNADLKETIATQLSIFRNVPVNMINTTEESNVARLAKILIAKFKISRR